MITVLKKCLFYGMIRVLKIFGECKMEQVWKKYFDVYRQKDNTFLVTTTMGKTVAVGVDYNVRQAGSGAGQTYIAVTDKDGLVTLYDKYGQSLPNAKRVVKVYWNDWNYEVKQTPESDFKRYKLFKYQVKFFPNHMRLIAAGIGVAAVGVSQIYGCCKKQDEFEPKTQMTYLGISNGVALFDTDGNKQTAETVSFTSSKDHTLSNRQIGRLYGCEGQTHSIAKWREIIGFVSFENTR